MQEDFHYYATYCAAYIAGFSQEESMDICYSAQFVDHCSRTLLNKIKAPLAAATTQLQGEMMDAKTTVLGIQDITRIWSSFHFLPLDLYSKPEGRRVSKRYLSKYRLLCGPNGSLVTDTVELAKGKSLQAIGIAMHVLADTWAHRYFAGTPSLVLNNVGDNVYEIHEDEGIENRYIIKFNHNPASSDCIEKHAYTNTLFQQTETAIMNLGHGRCGHLPDYSFMKYAYLPMWMNYEEVIKDNVEDYYKAFCQMVYAMTYLRGERDIFELNTYDTERVSEYEDKIKAILSKRQLDACEDWKSFAESLSGNIVEKFSVEKYQDEYTLAGKEEKEYTYLGGFIHSALAQKSMVTHSIFKSGNLIAGFSVDFIGGKFRGMSDFRYLIEDVYKTTGESKKS